MANNKDIETKVDKHTCDCEVCHPQDEQPTAEKNKYLEAAGLDLYTREFKEWVWKLFRKVHARIGHVEEDLAELKNNAGSAVDYEIEKTTSESSDIYTLVEKKSGTSHGQIIIENKDVCNCTFKKEDTTGHAYDEKFTNPIGLITSDMTLNDLDGMKMSQVISMLLFTGQKPVPDFPTVTIQNNKIIQTNNPVDDLDFISITLEDGIASCTDDNFDITGPIFIYNGTEFNSLTELNNILAESKIKYGSANIPVIVKYHASYKEDPSYENDVMGTITIKPLSVPSVSLTGITIDGNPYQSSNVYELEDNKFEITANVNLGTLTHGTVYANYNGVEYPAEIIDGKIILTIDNIESSEDVQNIVLTVKNEQYNKSSNYTIQIKFEVPEQIYAGVIKYNPDDYGSSEELFEYVESGDIDIYDDEYIFDPFIDVTKLDIKEADEHKYYKFASKYDTENMFGFVLICTTADPNNIQIVNNDSNGNPDIEHPESLKISSIKIPSPTKDSVRMNAVYMIDARAPFDSTTTLWIRFN